MKTVNYVPCFLRTSFRVTISFTLLLCYLFHFVMYVSYLVIVLSWVTFIPLIN